MPTYRYLVADLLTGTIREEVPFSQVRFSHVLNRPGAFSASINLRHPKATRNNLDPGRTALHVERDGQIVWSGILWTARASVEQATVEVGGEGWWSYFRRREIKTTRTYLAQDQFFIARDLLNYAQGISGGNVGVTVGSQTCGVLRDRTYYHYERKNLAEAVEQLAAVQNGFDFAIEAAWSGSSITKTFVPAYPKRGRRTNIVLELGVNIEGLSQDLDASNMANSVTALGAGEGDTMLIATVSDPSQLSAYPLLEATETWKDVSVFNTLDGHARSALTARSETLESIPMVLAHPSPDVSVGSFITGDELSVRGNDGFISVDTIMRVQSYEVSVDENGREVTSLGLIPLEVWA
jgi:hypothetical protein